MERRIASRSTWIRTRAHAAVMEPRGRISAPFALRERLNFAHWG
jgi:hypothetical protein